MQISNKLLFISIILVFFFVYPSYTEETNASELNIEEILPEEIKKEIDPEQVELNKEGKKKKVKQYSEEDDEDEFEAQKRKENNRRRKRRYDDYEEDEDYEVEDDEEEYERNTKPRSRKEKETKFERERESRKDYNRRDRGGRDDPYEDFDDPEEYFERNRARRPPTPRRERPDLDREERIRDHRRRPPMDDYPPEYRRRRDRKDDGDREKHFDEMKRRMQERQDSGDHYKTTKTEKQQPIIDKYSNIIWGEEHPFLSHWISQVANMAPENGVLANDWMRREASHISINVDDFKDQNVDLGTELLYTGYIEYEQRLKDYDIHITNKFVPYIACRPKSKRVLKEEGEEEKKIEL